MLSKKEILKPLNEEQKVATKNYLGKMAIIAGAGSGKTKTIVSRAAYMLADGVLPSSILIFTFTRKAAHELKTRVEKCMGDEAKKITVKTYHAFGLLLLKEFISYTGRNNNFHILEEKEKKKLLKEIIEDFRYSAMRKGKFDTFFDRDLDLISRNISEKISRWKEQLLLPKFNIKNIYSDYIDVENYIYHMYQQRLIQDSLFDIDDLIFESVQLLMNFPEVKNKVHKRYKFVIADEVQDSSERDIKFISLLGEKTNNICLVGDDSQSIYGFRGANVEYFIDYIKAEDYKINLLKRNYRSTKNIVDSGNKVISQNKKQIKKVCYTENNNGCKIINRHSKNSETQIFDAISFIESLVTMGKYSYKDIAILYRTRQSYKFLKAALLKNKIPHKVNNSCKGQKLKCLEELYECVIAAFSDDKKMIKDILERQILEGTIIPLTARKFWNEYRYMRDIIFEYNVKDYKATNIKEMLKQITENTHFLQALKEAGDFDYKKEKLIDAVVSYLIKYESIEDFAVEIEFSKNNKENENNIYLGTIHSSKGLEWPVVIIIDVVEGILPYESKEGANDKEEERRLFYVGITRAKNLVVLFSHNCSYIGEGKEKDKKIRARSSFIAELDQAQVLEV